MLFIQPYYKKEKKIYDVLSLDHLRSFGSYDVLALQCFASLHISKRKNTAGSLEAKHCKAIVRHKDQKNLKRLKL